jgi:hypothetical protein
MKHTTHHVGVASSLVAHRHTKAKASPVWQVIRDKLCKELNNHNFQNAREFETRVLVARADKRLTKRGATSFHVCPWCFTVFPVSSRARQHVKSECSWKFKSRRTPKIARCDRAALVEVCARLNNYTPLPTLTINSSAAAASGSTATSRTATMTVSSSSGSSTAAASGTETSLSPDVALVEAVLPATPSAGKQAQDQLAHPRDASSVQRHTDAVAASEVNGALDDNNLDVPRFRR